jgi:PTH1 family peptidyl-tRNA hydrolase
MNLMSTSFLVVGLGNPGEKYARTRHNMGRMVLEHIAQSRGVEFSSRGKTIGLTAVVPFTTEEAMFLLPDTFMNKSGAAVKAVASSPIVPRSLVVVYDDVDLPWGVVRVACNRGSGGHNGVESIIKTARSKDFIRIRIGVAPVGEDGAVRKPTGENGVVNFLMHDISKHENDELPEIVKRVEEALELIVSKGLDRAMNVVNSTGTISKGAA